MKTLSITLEGKPWIMARAALSTDKAIVVFYDSGAIPSMASPHGMASLYALAALAESEAAAAGTPAEKQWQGEFALTRSIDGQEA